VGEYLIRPVHREWFAPRSDRAFGLHGLASPPAATLLRCGCVPDGRGPTPAPTTARAATEPDLMPPLHPTTTGSRVRRQIESHHQTGRHRLNNRSESIGVDHRSHPEGVSEPGHRVADIPYDNSAHRGPVRG